MTVADTPYGTPRGAARFLAPAALEPWTEIRDAVAGRMPVLVFVHSGTGGQPDGRAAPLAAVQLAKIVTNRWLCKQLC